MMSTTGYQSAASAPDCWAFFDKCYCISLDKRLDRRNLAKKQFANINLSGRVEFVVVEAHPTYREQGIYESHMLCLRKGLEGMGQHILVFEDDVFFKGFDAGALAEACTSLRLADRWDAFFLGCISSGSSSTGNRNLAKIRFRCLSHAYAMNRSFAEHIVQQPWDGIPFDELLRRSNADCYALYPLCAFQGLLGSDNQTVVVDRIRRMLGGLPFIQRMNELYQNFKLALLLAPVVVVAALMTLLVMALGR